MRSITGVISKFHGLDRIPIELQFLKCRLQCSLKTVVIDVGCGRGDKSLYLSYAMQHNLGYVIAIDLNANILTQAKALLTHNDSYVDIVQCDAHLLPFRSDSVDVVLLWNVLMFVLNDVRVLEEAYRVLKKHGLAVISVYNVKTGFRNYNLTKLLRLLSFRFTPVSIRAPTKDQLIILVKKVFAKPFFEVLKVPLSRILPLIAEYVLQSETTKLNVEKHAYVLIPRDVALHEYLENECRKYNYVTKTYTAMLTHFYNSVDRVYEFLKLMPKDKCILRLDEVRTLLSSLGISRAALGKAVNDLARLGILRGPEIFSEVVELCDYVPMLNTKGIVSINPVIFWHLKSNSTTEFSRIISISLVTGNPIIREALNTIYLRYCGEASLEEFVQIVRENVRSYWSKCHGIDNNHLNQVQELQRLSNVNEARERIIAPLSKLGLINEYNDIITLTTFSRKLLEFIR